MKPFHIDEDDEFSAFLIGGKRNALVEFWAPWCGPCRVVAPMVEEIAEDFGPRLTVIRTNIDEAPVTGNDFGISSIPTLIVFHRGEVAERFVGVQPKNRLVEAVAPYAAPPDKPPPDAEVLAITDVDGQLRVVALLEDGSYHYIDDTSRLHGLLYHISIEAMALSNAIDEFETMINDSSLKEKDFQDFFEAYPQFILNDNYKEAHPHIILEKDEGNLIPDFMLEPVNTNHLCDILDIKTPAAKVFTLRKNRPRFSAAVYEGIAQLREYQSYFDEPSSRERIAERYGLVAYKPRLFLVIGKRGTVDPFAVKRMEQGLQDVAIQTYDDILTRAQAKLQRYREGGTHE